MLMSRPMSTRPEREISSRVEDWMMKLRSSARLRLSTWVVLWKSLDMAGTSLSDLDSSAVDKIGKNVNFIFYILAKNVNCVNSLRKIPAMKMCYGTQKAPPAGGA